VLDRVLRLGWIWILEARDDDEDDCFNVYDGKFISGGAKSCFLLSTVYVNKRV